MPTKGDVTGAFSRKIHQQGAPVGDDPRRRLRAHMREMHKLGAPVREAVGDIGHSDRRRRGRGLPGDALTTGRR